MDLICARCGNTVFRVSPVDDRPVQIECVQCHTVTTFEETAKPNGGPQAEGAAWEEIQEFVDALAETVPKPPR